MAANLNITIKGNSDEQIKLHNGDLITTKAGTMAILVSSWNKSDDKDGGSRKYCALIDIESGLRTCSEPCSRDTTRERILNHLRFINCSDIKDFIHVPCRRYNIDITIFD